MNRMLLTSLVVTAMVCAMALPAEAQPKADYFWADIHTDGTVFGTGDGYNAGTWYEYPNTGWWNQWFYDDPPDPLRWKEITYEIFLSKELPDAVDIEVAINWSTLLYPETGPGGPPPLPPLTPGEEDEYIGREIIFSGPVTNAGVELISSAPLIIPDYNPEWVSIDVRLLSQNPPDTVHISGTVYHECIPEPATLSLLALSGLAMIRRKR